MPSRVDKQWKDKGLSEYPTDAIIGTLNHYGVVVDEAALKASAADKSPLALAGEWKASWKGTGQFLTFPYAAANELVTRLFPDRPTPMRVAKVVLELIAQGLRKVAGQPAELDKPFAEFEGLVPKLPAVGAPRDQFLQEFVTFIESWARPFNELPEQLTKAGHRADGHRFALVQEVLFTDRAGTVQALVRAAAGERDAALADLSTWAAEAGRDVFARYAALDALYQLEAWDVVKRAGLEVFDASAAQEKWALADSIAHLLAHMVEQLPPDRALREAVEQRLDLAHAHSGGHHHHH